MKSAKVRVGEQSVAVYTSEGTGTPVVLCHGNSFSSRVFQKQLEGPLGRHLRLIALDLPGHGLSDRARDPRTQYTLPGYAQVLIEVARSLDLTSAVFAGASLGGHVVLHASERLPDARGFLVFGTPPLSRPPAMDEAFHPNPALAAAVQTEPTDEGVHAFLTACLTPSTAGPDMFVEDFRRTDPQARVALAASVAANELYDETRIVAELDRPLAIVHGAHDALVNRAYIDRINAPTLWRGTVQEMPDAGHTPQWQAPASFDALLEAFVLDCIGKLGP